MVPAYRGNCPARLRAAWLWRDPHSDPGGAGCLQAQRGRELRHREQGDVPVHGQGRPRGGHAAREHRRGGAGGHPAQAAHQRRPRAALLHRPPVPLRAHADGPLPAVLPDRGRELRRGHPRERGREPPHAPHLPHGAGPQAPGLLHQQRGHARVPPRLPRGHPGLLRPAGRPVLRGLPSPLAIQPAARAGLQECEVPAGARGAPHPHRPPGRGLGPAPRTPEGPAHRSGHPFRRGSPAGARAGLLHPHGLRGA